MIAGVEEKDLMKGLEDALRREVEERRMDRENIYINEEYLPVENIFGMYCRCAPL
jgi:hypothetical protein